MPEELKPPPAPSPSQESYPFLKTLIDKVTNRVTPAEAAAFGVPQAEGFSTTKLRLLLSQPERAAQIQETGEKIETAPVRRRLMEAQANLAQAKADAEDQFGAYRSGKMSKDEQEGFFHHLLIETAGQHGMWFQMNDPEGYEFMKQIRNEVGSKLGHKFGVKTPVAGKTVTAVSRAAYAKIASGPGGKKLGWNTATKKWEEIK